MSVLAYQSIIREIQAQRLVVRPFELANVQPSSLDFRLADDLDLGPLEFKLASTLEWVHIPYNIQAQIHGRSSVGRIGVTVHITAGFIDPGFSGTLTLECFNADNKPHNFKQGDRVAQLAFLYLDEPTERPYNGRYMNQNGTTKSKFKE